MKVLLSIRPEYVQRIFSGEKRFEYRKAIFSNKAVKTVVVYCTMPVGRIVGEFTIEEILQNRPEAIWAETKEYAGVDKAFFKKYFDGRSQAFAIRIGRPRLYESPIDPRLEDSSFVAPQSFMYLA